MTAPTAVTPVQLAGETGVATPTPAACDNTNGNTCVNYSSTIFRLSNSGGSSGSFVLTPGVQFRGHALATKTITIAAAGDLLYQFDPEVWGHEIVLTGSAATMKIAVIQP